MSDLRLELVHYLALRRSLGFKLERTGQLLDLFVGYLEAEGAEKITTELALAWATLPTDCDPSWHGARLLALRGFAKYLATIDPESEVPPPDLLPARSRRVSGPAVSVHPFRSFPYTHSGSFRTPEGRSAGVS
jgi:hypothetical protein